MTAEQSTCVGRTPACAHSLAATFIAALLCFLATSAGAQEPPPPPTASTPDATTPPAAAAPADDPPQLLMVPYQDLKGTINDLGASIMVPLRDYLDWQKRLRDTPPQAPAVVTSAAYRVVVEKELAKVRAELKISAPGKPWAELPVSFGEAAIASIEGADENLLLRGEGNGSYRLLIGKSGEHTVVLNLVARIRTLPDGKQLVMNVPAVAVTTFEMEIPEAEQTVEFEPRQAVSPVDDSMGKTLVRANLGATNQITAKWFPKASIKPEMELLASVTNDQSVSIEDGLIHRDAWLRFEILRGKLSQLRIAIPKGVRVLDVSGDPRIRGWKTADEPQRQVITVDLLSGTSDPVPVEVHTEGPLPEGTFTAAGLSEQGEAFGIHALDVIRESGHVAVKASGELELTMTEQQRLSRVNDDQLPPKIQAGNASGFRYFAPGFVLKGSVKPIQPRLTVNHTARLVFQDEELRVVSTLDYQVERAGIFELQLKVPEDLVVDAVECDAMREHRFDEASRTLTVTLSKRTEDQVAIAIRAHRPLAAMAAAEQALPIIEPLGVERELGSVFVFSKPSVEVVTSEAAVKAAQPLVAPAEMAEPNASLTSSWSFTRRPVVIPVTIHRKPARLSAEIATAIQVQPQIIEVNSRLTFRTEYAGLDTFRLMAPAGVSDRLRIESLDPGSPLRQKTAGPAENGWVTWTITMQREVLGAVPLNVAYDLRDTAVPGAGAPTGANLALIRPIAAKASGGADVPLTRIVGQIAISKDDTLSVTSVATGGDVEPIDVRELTLLPQSGAAAYRYFRQPDDKGIDVSIQRSRNEVQPVVATVIRKGLVEIVAGDKADSSATYRCRYRVKSSERQRILVHLPVNLELLGAFVNSRDVRLETADLPGGQRIGESWNSYWLNVSREGANDDEFIVTLHFLWKVNPELGGGSYSRGSLELPMPVFGAKDAPAAVQELRVVAWTPREYVLVGRPNDFQPLSEPGLWSRFWQRSASRNEVDLDSWIEPGNAPALTLPKDGRTAFAYINIGGANRLRVDWWNRVRVTWIVSMALVLIALLLVRTSWENKLGMLLFGGLALTLFALNDRAAAAELLAAGRYGLAFLLGLWVVHGLFGARRAATDPKTPPTAPPTEPAAPTSPAPIPGGA
ncbi:hypothetical protein Pan44_29020 [Caulifigura coniformis]|uniref:Uncharacterized protein n=1 Tax=Caulifigura coniformis TaxID=2527983 RepID=A0A517SFF3_9PLAN|nr:hypothetical protein [Caulifigura coniformis]QDT54863.1 hypothetical protein Pan44_29020 [Caulifigura coniformis]